jgi:hypothetical protein
MNMTTFSKKLLLIISVKRNLRRFPLDFMFQLTSDEWNSLRLQIETSKRGGRRYMPYAFTEQGIAMLSGLLNSDIAIDTNIVVIIINDFEMYRVKYYFCKIKNSCYESANFSRHSSVKAANFTE